MLEANCIYFGNLSLVYGNDALLDYMLFKVVNKHFFPF